MNFTFCFTNPQGCAFDQGGEGAKGTEESYDTGFGKGGLAADLAAVVGLKCSFTSTTEVTTDHGKQAIGTLQMGERVLAYNPKTGKKELEPILHVWINPDHDLVDLTITTTTKGSHGHITKMSEVVHTNQKHPFFTLEHGFLPVGQITQGTHLLRADGRVGVVTGWKVVPGTKVMYNLEVAQDHTFTVGIGQWVVHNSGCHDLAQEAYNSLLAKRRAGEDVRAVTTSNVLDANGNPITDVTNGSPGETSIGTAPAKGDIWGGCCAETHIAAQIADALANGGSIDGENIQIGFAHIEGIGPCGDCRENLSALASQYGEVNVSFFSYTETKGSGYDIWTFLP